MRLASLNPLRLTRALATWAERRATALRVDTLSAVGTVVHGVEGRIVAYLRGVESRITTAAEHREERIHAQFEAISAEIAELRARHGFVGDPVAESPAVGEAGERLVPRRSPAGRDPRLPPGRPHP